jgi:hypothetical protein
VLRPRQQEKLAKGAKDEEHAMSPKLNFGIAVNKLARIAWSVLAHGRTFEASKIQAA